MGSERKVLQNIKCGSIDAADVSFPNLIDSYNHYVKNNVMTSIIYF